MDNEVDNNKAEASQVLIVDDVELNCNILEACLKDTGLLIRKVTRGQEALDLVSEDPPDIILLDIKMPGLDGYDVCERLKQNQATRRIPIIFVSATEESCDKIKALEMGAVDFISKPFDRSEVKARVQTHLQMKRLEDIQRQYSENLEQLVEERTRQLIASDRMVQIGTLSAGVAHEINNPTAFIRGNIQTFERFWPIIQEALESEPVNDPDQKEKITFIRDEVPKIINGILKGTQRISKIVSGLKTFAHQGQSRKTEVDLNEIIKESLELCHTVLKHEVEVSLETTEEPVLITADAQQLEQVLVNLITNAAHAMEGSQQRRLTIASRILEDQVEISVSDTGYGMDKETLKKIWNPFFTTKPVGKGTGLGMSISQGIIEDHDGTIRIESTLGQGTTFFITLPMQASHCLAEIIN